MKVTVWPGAYPGFFFEGRELEFHPIANVFPLMEGEEFRELCKDIRENGQQQPVLVYEGKILDGRNRYRACVEVGEEPWTESWQGDNPVEAALSLNLHRRHLTSGQRAMIGVEVERVMARRAKVRQGQRTDIPQKIAGSSEPSNGKPTERIPAVSGEAREQAAKLVGTNRQYISDAKKLTASDPEAAEAVRKGETTLSKAMESYRKPKETTVRDTLEGDSADTLDLPPFNLPEERRVYRKIITNLKDIVKHDPDRIASYCKSAEEADREDEYLTDLIERLDTLRTKFRAKKREFSNLRAVK